MNGVLMEWRRPVVKSNGEVRKTFQQWGIPKDICRSLGLKDGDTCRLTVRIGDYSSERETYRLSSDKEVYLSKPVAEILREKAKSDPTATIIFKVFAKARTPEASAFDKARKKALEDGAFDPSNEADSRSRTAALIVRRQGQPAFRAKLLKVYGGCCAISRCDCPDALEAAHIRPFKGSHTNHIQNGILLRCDLHTLFDLGKIRILPTYKVSVADDLQGTVYREFHNRRLFLPREKKYWPDCSKSTARTL